MKRFLLVFMSVLMLFSMCACGDDGENSSTAEIKDIDVAAEAESIVEKYQLSGGNYYSSSSDDSIKLDDDLVRSYFGDASAMPDFSAVEAYAVYIDETKPVKPCEFGIFKMKDGADKETFMAFLRARIDLKIQNSAAYPSMDTEPLTTAKFTVKGNYIWYCAVKGGNDDINSVLEGKL